MAQAKKTFRVLAGLDYPAGARGQTKRAEVGDVVDDLPAKSLPWLLKQAAIEEVTDDDVRALEAEPAAGE